MRVRCINNELLESVLKIGEIYKVKEVSKECFAIIDESDKIVKYAFLKSRFEIVEDGNMRKIKTRKWEDLEGLEGKDKWGNKTKISKVNLDCTFINIWTYGDKGYTKTNIIDLDERLKGGRERILEELGFRGFDVEFIGKPELTDRQRQELEYMRDIRGMKYILKNGKNHCHAYETAPLVREIFHRCDLLWEDYDFISCGNDEPWSIEELLKD